MQIALNQPELEKFVSKLVEAGRFPSPEAVVEAGLARLMLDADSDELDPDTLAAIERAEAQFDRGEGRPFREVAGELRKEFIGPQEG